MSIFRHQHERLAILFVVAVKEDPEVFLMNPCERTIFLYRLLLIRDEVPDWAVIAQQPRQGHVLSFGDTDKAISIRLAFPRQPAPEPASRYSNTLGIGFHRQAVIPVLCSLPKLVDSLVKRVLPLHNHAPLQKG